MGDSKSAKAFINKDIPWVEKIISDISYTNAKKLF